jgi:CheY-like chemotaxis protein
MDLRISPELPKLIEALTGLAWPVLAIILIWKIFPSLRKVIESRQFTIKIGGMEVSAQQASENLALQVDDLQKKVSELRAALDDRKISAAVQPHDNAEESMNLAPPVFVTVARRILWVDDQPKNNVFEIAKLGKEGIEVVEVTSTADAMRLVISGREPFGLVISDMGRYEEGEYRAKAGLLLIQNIRRAGLQDLPIIVYSSGRNLQRTRDEVRQAGGNAATASPLELFELVQSFIPAKAT